MYLVCIIFLHYLGIFVFVFSEVVTVTVASVKSYLVNKYDRYSEQNRTLKQFSNKENAMELEAHKKRIKS